VNSLSLELKSLESLRETYRCLRELQRSDEWRVRIKRRHRLVRRLSLRERHRRVRTLLIACRPHYDHRAIAHHVSETPNEAAKHRQKNYMKRGRREGDGDVHCHPAQLLIASTTQYICVGPKISSEQMFRFFFSSTGVRCGMHVHRAVSPSTLASMHIAY
jgi:hypothetical protein